MPSSVEDFDDEGDDETTSSEGDVSEASSDLPELIDLFDGNEDRLQEFNQTFDVSTAGAVPGATAPWSVTEAVRHSHHYDSS